MWHTSDMDSVPNARRLKGALAAATEFASDDTAKERIYTGLAKSVTVRVKCSAITGTLTVSLNPMLSDANASITTGTMATLAVVAPEVEEMLLAPEMSRRLAPEADVVESVVSIAVVSPPTLTRFGMATAILRLWWRALWRALRVLLRRLTGR